MTTLDRSRPFGTIYPAHNGASYEQDGRMFDAHGHPLGQEPRKPGRPRKDADAPIAVPASAPPSGQLAAQLEDA